MYAVLRHVQDNENPERMYFIPARQAQFKDLKSAQDFAMAESVHSDNPVFGKPFVGSTIVVEHSSRVAPWNHPTFGVSNVDGDADSGRVAIAGSNRTQKYLARKVLNHQGIFVKKTNVGNIDFQEVKQGLSIGDVWASRITNYGDWPWPISKGEGADFKAPIMDDLKTLIQKPTVKQDADEDASQALDILEQQHGMFGKQVAEAIRKHRSKDGVDETQVKILVDKWSGSAVDEAVATKLPAVVAEQVEKALDEAGAKKITVVTPQGTEVPVGLVHEKFTELLNRVQVMPNAFLVGPSGSGKTHAAAQVAKALDRDYASISCSAGMSEGQLLGRLIPSGEGGKFEYAQSDFIRLYENGGVFLLDEMDAADPNVLIVINDAVSGGRISVPNRVEKPFAERHSNFVLIAGANTTGNGRDRMYVGRNQLDKATLRRFKMNLIEWDYSPAVEQALCPDSELRSEWIRIRKNVKEKGIRQVVDTQSLRDAYQFRIALKWTVKDCVEQLMIDWPREEKTAALA